MKKIFILVFILILCTGCIKVNNPNNKDIIIDKIVVSSTKPNTISMGYKYYLPFGIEKVYDKDYNQKFKLDDNYIYLYVDVVSYYHKNTLNFSEENSYNTYYYKKITNGNKTGYVKIIKEEESYFIKIVYNYAKIEAFTKENNIEEVLTNSMIIINSIDYNDNLIKKILENDYNFGAEKEYKIKKPEDAKSKFSEYLSEYVQNEETGISDLPDY